ncbi:MAG TPA: DUF2785 domain-containing protein [Ramlibacter sp.]|uniref:DUF2785 domain-containing protein n=1 Tax=Ramlibacter sp. TaxID=1917967 RepID=UPI002C0C9B92|nr:DUF2785 domain-containing protein [Ramlibacter sp.]HVZ46922.1 DUF2785 domain-containing protein [Ramlibacter sp.]
MNRAAIAIWLGLVAVALPAEAATCPPAGYTVESLTALKSSRWQLGQLGPASTQLLALALVDCLEHPDPQLRDELAFDGLQAMMRAGALGGETLERLYARLIADLGDPDDPRGFRRPFDALTLAEVARVDRLEPFLTPEDRHALVFRAFTFLVTMRDYRGFDEKEGWRHGVAHGADLVLQLALNPRIDAAEGEMLRDAIGAQVIASGETAYRYGEPERLMKPVFYLARRGWWSAQQWEGWFDELVARLPADAFKSQAGLAARHNAAAFVSALYVAVRESGNAEVEALLLPGLRKALQKLD